jgi:hypothetical protein
MDSMVIVWVCSSIIAYTLLWRTADAFVNRCGLAYDAAGLYFIFRFLLRDIDDIKQVCKFAAIVFVPLTIGMCIEKATGRNPFYVFGGVPQFTLVREGVLRCQGPFAHPILAGTFGAVWLPFFLGLWEQGRHNRSFAAIGIVASTLITYLSGSSGPAGAYLAGILGTAMWYLRERMRIVRWSIVLALIFLHIVMKAPVWFIFARISIFSGSTGWHRANLIDQTIRHFFDWWLLGTKETISWGVWAGDITNQFILEGVRGGLVTLISFIWIVVLAFSSVGTTVRRLRTNSRRSQRFVWAMGAVLFAHVVAFLDVSYFDQNVVNWYFVLASVAAASCAYRYDRSRSGANPAISEELQFPGCGDVPDSSFAHLVGLWSVGSQRTP